MRFLKVVPHLEHILVWSSILGLVIFGAACTEDHADGEKIVIPSVSKVEIEAVASKRILFAHQSVGGNILDGMRSIAKKDSIPLNITETRDVPSEAKGIFHFWIGANGDPAKKLREFEESWSSGNHKNVDLAMVKLCYVDFVPQTDAAALAREYVRTIRSLQDKFPETRFVAMTAPLTTVQTGPKAWMKRILGRNPYGIEENYKRQVFNQALRKEFPPNRLFDIAEIESESAAHFEFNGAPLPTLNSTLTSDDGHLNDAGQRLVGAALLKFIASAG